MPHSTRRTSKRQIPYVEITAPPPKGAKRLLDSISRSLSPSSRADDGPARKRGKIREGERSAVVASSVADEQSRPVSPTVSEFVQGSRTASSRGRSPTPSQGEWDVEMDGVQPSSSTRSSRASSSSRTSTSVSEVKLEDLIPYPYEQVEDEVDEADLMIPEEQADEQVDGDEDASSDESGAGTAPVRLLQDFTIYDETTNVVIPANLLPLSAIQDRNYTASGVVFPWPDDNPETPGTAQIADNERDRVKLTRIMEFTKHDISEDEGGVVSVDGKFYVRTKHAWYILGRPSEDYTPFFASFWRQCRVANLFLQAVLEDRSMSAVLFGLSLTELDAASPTASNSGSMDILGRYLEESDYTEHDDVKHYVHSAALDLHEHLGISHLPIIRKLMKEFDPDAKAPKAKVPVVKKKDQNHKTNQPTTFTTPIVSRIAKGLFRVEMNVAKGAEDDSSPPSSSAMKKKRRVVDVHEKNPKKIVTYKNTDGVYQYVLLDGVRYDLGDVVMVVPEKGWRGKFDHGRSQNKLGNSMWFCQIKSFTITSSAKTSTFHAQWYLHGCKTVLNELAHPRSLYPINDCMDQPLSAIYRKCQVEYFTDRKPRVADDDQPNSDKYHCDRFYNHEFSEFVDLPPSILDPSLRTLGECPACQFVQEEEAKCVPRFSSKGELVYGGALYHTRDFVYVLPQAGKLLRIGQIVSFNPAKSKVSVRFLKRLAEIERSLAVEPFEHKKNVDLDFEERRLVLTTSKHDVEDVPAPYLSGLCYVKHLCEKKAIEEWIQHDDHFYAKNYMDSGRKLPRLAKGDLKVCDDCLEAHEEALEEKQRLMDTGEKLVGLELFAGAGGLGYGMESSGFVKTKVAVEFWSAAADTYRTNHRGTTVICQDTNHLLQYLVERDNNKNPSPLKDKLTHNDCKEMPSRGEIDFIYGGPPCQAFSRANHTRSDDDMRSTMPCNMLGFVEHYRPKYFLLENVAGLQDFAFLDRRFTEAGEAVPVKQGMVKFILRTLMELGYQVRYRLLQAAQYGVPQSRTRLIFFGAQVGLTLPEFPVPLYAFPKGAMRLGTLTGPGGTKVMIPPPSRWNSKWVDGNEENPLFHQCAPFEMISILDAIGDLPPFDWKCPTPEEGGRGLTAAQRKKFKVHGEEEVRTWFGEKIPQFDAVADSDSGFVGFEDPVAYATEPQTDYQRYLRKGVGAIGPDAHYTRRCAPRHVQCTVMVPLKPDANHTNIPKEMLPPHMTDTPAPGQARNKFYGRIGGHEYFKCAMTLMAPNLKNTYPLHPRQKRIFTVRECARAQGFPDNYKFCSDSDLKMKPKEVISDQIKQIGNAVAVPFARALGKEIGKALIFDWKMRPRKEKGKEREHSLEV